MSRIVLIVMVVLGAIGSTSPRAQDRCELQSGLEAGVAAVARMNASRDYDILRNEAFQVRRQLRSLEEKSKACGCATDPTAIASALGAINVIIGATGTIFGNHVRAASDASMRALNDFARCPV